MATRPRPSKSPAPTGATSKAAAVAAPSSSASSKEATEKRKLHEEVADRVLSGHLGKHAKHLLSSGAPHSKQVLVQYAYVDKTCGQQKILLNHLSKKLNQVTEEKAAVAAEKDASASEVAGLKEQIANVKGALEQERRIRRLRP